MECIIVKMPRLESRPTVPATRLGSVTPFLLGLKVSLTIGPLAVVRLEVQTRVVPGRGVTEIIFRETILLLKLLLVPRLDLRDGDVLLPMMSPIELTLSGLTWSGILSLLADAHAIDQGHEESDKAKDQDNDANVPKHSC